MRALIAGDVAGLGGDVYYYKTDASLAYFHTIYEGVVLMAKGSAGYIDGWNNDDVALVDRFYKGSNTFRGFATAGIGPRATDTLVAGENPENGDALGGRAYAIGTAEISFPLGLPEAFGLRGVVFGDVGSVFLPVDKVDVNFCNCLRAAVGAGVLWKSPFGPLRFDFSDAVMKEAWDRTEIFRFAAGTSF